MPDYYSTYSSKTKSNSRSTKSIIASPAADDGSAAASSGDDLVVEDGDFNWSKRYIVFFLNKIF